MKKKQSNSVSKGKQVKLASAVIGSRKGRNGTKSARVISLLERNDGASIHEMMKVTGWQAHSVRGFMAGTLKKQGKPVTSTLTTEGERRYRLVVAS
jgi:hypothetical protein